MKHLVIPDTQCRPGDDFGYLTALGNFIVAKRPEHIIMLGDHADMPSLSSYDVGKKSFEGRRYLADIEAAKDAMATLLRPLNDSNAKAKKGHRERYTPKMTLTLGNHENRINRAVNDDAKLEGVLSINHLDYPGFGWDVHDFLDVVVIDGVAYSHYYVTGVACRPAGSAAAQLRRTNMSSIAGHQQGLQIATAQRADGKRLTSVIAGSFYEHAEDYLGPQGNQHYRGVLMLYDVNDGEFNLVPVPLKYLKEKYL